MKLKKNETLDLDIVDITNLGFGVARRDGEVIFTSDTVPGDRVRAKIIKVQSSFAVGRVEEYISRSSLLCSDRCEFSGCKSCAYKNLSYDYEKGLKEEAVRQIFKKAGLSEVEVLPLVGSPSTHGYRNKAQYPIAKTKDGYAIGFYAPKSHRVTEAAACPLAPAVFSEILEVLRGFFAKHSLSVYNEESGEGLLRHIYLRRGEVSGEVLLTLVINGDSLPCSGELVGTITEKFPDIVGILININKESTNVILGEKFITLFGRDYIFDTLAGVKLKITAPSFYQVNHDAAELLYAKARELAKPTKSDLVLDLYCGAGSIGLSMADAVGEVIGIEIVESAVECAKFNAENNGINNASFYAGDASSAERLLSNAEKLRGEKISPDIVILDPPRGGTTEELINYISTLNPTRIVYISCNPQTLARDVVIFNEKGYFCDSVTPYDLFPATGHVESVVCLSREKADDCEDEPEMISDERSKYKSWSNLKKQMNDLICDSLKDKISYFYTSYHEVHNAYGRATINYNKKEMVAFSWVEMYAQELEVSQLYQEGKKVSYGELEKGKWIPECKLCDADFINSLTIYLKTDIAISLHSDNYLLRVFAYMDRRVGKRTLIKIKDDVEKLPDWVKQFYRIRCEADGIIFPLNELQTRVSFV